MDTQPEVKHLLRLWGELEREREFDRRPPDTVDLAHELETAFREAPNRPVYNPEIARLMESASRLCPRPRHQDGSGVPPVELTQKLLGFKSIGPYGSRPDKFHVSVLLGGSGAGESEHVGKILDWPTDSPVRLIRHESSDTLLSSARFAKRPGRRKGVVSSCVRWALRRFSNDMGIDLGAANTLVCVRGRGVVLNEPSLVVRTKDTHEVLLGGMAVGNAARSMLGRTPDNAYGTRPLRRGIIADVDATEAMLSYFISKVHDGHAWMRPQIIIAVPVGFSAPERRAVIHCAERAGARRVFLIAEPMAAAVGLDLPVTESRASLIIDIGGGTTKIAMLACSNVIVSISLPVAGDEFDRAIINHVRCKHNLLIGEQMAERIKLTIGSATPMEQERSMVITGLDDVSGLPSTGTISSVDVRRALSSPMGLICAAVRRLLEEAADDVPAAFVNGSATICGGGALVHGIAEAIGESIGLPAKVAADPMTAVARGTAVLLERPELLEQLTN